MAPAVSFADNVGGEATVGNSSPSVVSASVSADPVSPESYFDVNTRIKDNNTLSDVDNVIVTLFENTALVGDSDSKRDHYTLWFDPSDNSWHSGFASNTLGSAFIDGVSSTYPGDLSVTEDNYNFTVLLNGTASSVNDWDLHVEVIDSSSASDTLSTNNAFAVDTYVSYSVSSDGTINFSGSAGSSANASPDNPIDATSIETNVDFDMQNKLQNPAWENASTSDNIPAENTKFDTDGTPASLTSLGTSFNDVHTNQGYGEDLSRSVYYYLDIPAGTSAYTYTNTFTLEVVQN
jgi:hypothetical protein